MSAAGFLICASVTTAAAQTSQAASNKAPLEIRGPARVNAGKAAPLPVIVKPNASFGENVMIMQAPDWLSISHGDRVGVGIWLIPLADLPYAKINALPTAEGSNDLTVAAINWDGSVGWRGRLTVEITKPSQLQSASTPQAPPVSAGSEAQAARIVPREVAALPKTTTPANVAPAQPAAKPAPQAAASVQAKSDGPVTWQQMLNNNLTGPVKVPQKTAPARAVPKQERSNEELAGLARNVVRECTTCHNLYGQDVGIPVMVGLTYDRFMETMYLYRTKKRDHKAMTVVAQSLSEEETHALALYLGRIKPLAPGEDAQAVASAPSPTGRSVEIARRRAADPSQRKRIERWIRRGETMLDSGDIAQARLLLERATEYGDPRAAFLLATSFDPNAMPWRTGIGMSAEPLKARRWYSHAKTLGAGNEADQRLAALPAPRRQ